MLPTTQTPPTQAQNNELSVLAEGTIILSSRDTKSNNWQEHVIPKPIFCRIISFICLKDLRVRRTCRAFNSVITEALNGELYKKYKESGPILSLKFNPSELPIKDVEKGLQFRSKKEQEAYKNEQAIVAHLNYNPPLYAIFSQESKIAMASQQSEGASTQKSAAINDLEMEDYQTLNNFWADSENSVQKFFYSATMEMILAGISVNSAIALIIFTTLYYENKEAPKPLPENFYAEQLMAMGFDPHNFNKSYLIQIQEGILEPYLQQEEQARIANGIYHPILTINAFILGFSSALSAAFLFVFTKCTLASKNLNLMAYTKAYVKQYICPIVIGYTALCGMTVLFHALLCYTIGSTL